MASRKKKENTQQIGTYRKKKEQFDNSIGSYRNKLRQNYAKYMELLKANQENQRNEYYQQMNQLAGQDLLRTAVNSTGTQPKQTVTLDNVKQQAAKSAQQNAASAIQGTGYQPAKQQPQQQDDLMSRVLQVKKQEDKELEKWNNFILNSGAIGQSGISGAQAKAYTPTQTTADVLKAAAKNIKADRQAKKIEEDDVLLRAAAKDYAAQNPNGPETATWGQVKKGSQLEEVLEALNGKQEKKETTPEAMQTGKALPDLSKQPAQMRPDQELPAQDQVLRNAMITANRNGTGSYPVMNPETNRANIGQASQATAYNALGVKTPAMRQAEQIQKQASRVKELDDLVTGNVEHGTIHSARPENVSNMLTETNARASRSEIEILRHKGYYDNDNFDPEWWSQSYREQKLDEYNEDALQRQANIEELQAQIDAGGVTQSVVEPLLSLYTNSQVEKWRNILDGEGYTEEEKARAGKELDNLYRSVGINGQSAKDRAMHLYNLISPQEDLNTDNVRRMAYDEMNGLGSYERAIKSLKTYEKKKAFNDRIDQAIDGIVNPESNLDYQLRNEQAWLEYDNSQINRILNQNGWEESYNDLMSEPVTGDTEYHPELNLVNDPMSYFDKGTSTIAGNADYVYSVLGGGLKNTDIVAGDFHKAALMNPKERDKFISLYNDGKKAEAWAFYQGIEPMLNQLYAQYEELSMQDTASRYPILSSTVSLINTALQPAEMILNIPNYARSLMGIQNTTMDPKSSAYLNTRMKNTIRQTISKDLGDTWGKVYNGLMSGADSSLNFAIARALGLPDNLLQAGTLALFASQAFETSLQQNMKNNKGNYAYNMVEAALDAIIETGTEIATVERFMMNPTNLMRFTVRAITSEPAEEFTGALVEPYIKELAKHRNQYKDRAVQILGNHGYWNEQGSWVEVNDIDKATRQAMHEWNRDACLAAQEALVSVIPMIGFQGGRIAMSNIQTGRAITGDTTTAEERVERLMGAAESMGPESDSGKLAARIRSREASGKKASNYQLGQLVNDTMREATEQGSPEKVLSVIESVSPEQAKDVRKNLQLATEREIEDAEGERVKGPRGVIYNSDDGRSVHARLVGVTEIERQDEDGNKVKAPGVVIEVDGKLIPVDAAKVLTTSMETGELLRNARENPVFDANYTKLVLEEMEAGREGNPSILAAPAEAIRLAAYMGRKMPNTGINEETAKKLYNYSVKEKEALRKGEVSRSTTRGKGKGTATFKGTQYGTQEYKQALKKAGISNETQNRMGAWAEVARVAGIDLVFRDNAEIEEEKKKGNISFADEARGLYGSQGGNQIMLNIEAETTEKDENGKIRFSGNRRNIGVAFGHEFIHWLQEHSYEAYNALEKYVLEEQAKFYQREYGSQAYLYEALKRIAQSRGTTLMGAISEMVAESCDQIMLNEDVLNHLQETNKGLYEQFKGFVKDLVKRVQAATSELAAHGSTYSRHMTSINANMKEMARLVNLAFDEATGKVVEARAETKAEPERTTADYVQAEYVGTGKARTVQARITNPLMMKQGQFSWMPNQTAQSLLDSKEISLTPEQEAELRKVAEYGYEKIEDAWDHIAGVLQELGYDGIRMADGQYIALKNTQTAEEGQTRLSQAEMDAEYEQAVKDKDTAKQEEMVKAAAQKAGYTMRVYHGTPYGGFTQFRDWSYFTENKEYADRYNHPSQSSTRGYYSDTQNPMTYALYMNPGRVFDTRQKKAAQIFEQFRQEYGLSPLTENGLPDWTDGRDIIEFIEENNLPYDTIILNEGADGGYGAPVVSRGVSYVTRSNMVKSAEPVTYDDQGNVIPLSERFNQGKTDIRYSQAEMTDSRQEELYGALEEANAKVKALRERVRAMKPEVDAWTERITEAFDNGTFDQIQEEYKEWEKGYVQLREELTEAERAYRQANQDFEDYIEQRDVAQEKAEIEKSGLPEAEYRRKQAVKTFGTTSDFNEAGYLMPDGKMLDFSGKKNGGQRGTRSEDHRAIGQIYASSRTQGGEAMMSFMRDGNIRVMASTPGIDIISTIEPTAEQYEQIRKMARRFAGEEYFNIDFTDENGQVVDTLEYDGRVNPDRIVNDIKSFYKTGVAPQQSVVSQFHYSQADGDAIDVETWMETRTPGSFRTEDERIMWQTWKKLRNDVRMVNFRIEEYKKQIRALEAKGENLTAEERDQLRGLRNKLEVKQVQLDRLEKELRKTTSTEGFATMMRNANLVIGDFMAGKTQEQVTAAVDTMTNEVERAEKEIAKQEKELQKLGQESAVKTVRAALRSRGMNTAVNALRTQYGTTMSQDELEGRLAEIILKSLKGEDVTADIEALANDVVTRQAGYGSVEAEEALSALRGKTIVIGPGQQAEMKANHITLKDLQKRIKGSGIKLVYGESSTLDTNAEELEAEVPALKGMLDNEKASLENFVGYVENLLSLKNSNAEESGYDVKEVESFIGAMAQIMLNENAGGMSKADLIAKIKAEAGRIGTALNAVRRIRESLGTVRESGAKAQTWTGVLGQDLDQVLDYYDQVARMAARQERTQVRKTLVEQLKAENTKKLMQQQEKYEQMMKNERNARQLANDNMTLRSKINTVVKRISRLMTEETDLKNIPEEAKPLARLLVKMFVEHDSNYRRVTFSDNKQLQRAAENIRGWEKLFGGFDYDHGLDWLVTGEGDTADTELRDAVEDALVDIETGLMEYRNAEGRGTVSLQDRKNALTKIQDAVAKIYNVIQARRYAEIDGKRALTAELAASARDDMQHSRFRGEWTGWLGRRIGTARRGVIYGNMTPVYFFKNLRNGTLSSLFRGYESAENKNGLAIARAQAMMQRIAQETGYGTWDQERRYEIQLEKGGTVRLTLGEMMSLYATWQREMMNQLEENGPTKSFHLTLGGFITEPEQRGGVAGRQMQQQRPHRLTEGDMAKITAMMTPQQIEYVTRVVEYMTKEIGELGNEASMKMYGIRKFNEKWYFPFEVWRGVMSSKSTAGVQNAQQNAAAHQSFTKRRMNNARNALMIRDFTQTAARHIVAQINYNTFAPAIEWMQRVMNSKQMEGEDAESMTERNLWAMFQEVYGKDAYAYFKRFQQDMNGGATQQSKTFYDRLISTFRKSAVAGSLSVAAQQPLSYIRAAMEINPRWLIEAINPRYYRGSAAEMEKWSGVAVLKQMGKFDMGFGESAAQYIEPEARQRTGRRVYETLSDWTTALPNAMDRMTWTRMWTAAKLEQAHLHPEMDQNSDEFMELVANRFNDIIRRTQVYDSTLVRSQNMRDKNPGLKMLTSFMAEPTLTANVLADAIINVREHGGMRRLVTAAATYMLSAVAQAAVKGTMGAGRNPDKKKTWEENLWYRFMYNFISEANPMGLIPGYSNIVSLLKDGELDDNAMAMIGKVFDAAKTGYQLVSGQKDDVYRGIEDSAALIAQLFTNIPVKNLMRDARAMYNFFTQPYAQRETSQGVMRYQTEDLWRAGPELLGAINSWLGKEGYQTTVDAYAQRIYQAQKSGDEEAARMMSEYVTLAKSGAEDPEKALQSKLKSIAKKDKDASAEETMQYLQENGGSEQSVSTYIMDELKDGKIDAEEARKLLKQNEPDKSEDDIWWKVDRAEYAKENGTETPSGYYYRLTDAIDSNKAEQINAAVNELKKHGVTDKQIKTKLSSWKQDYLNATGDEKRRIRDALTKAYKAIGLTAEEAGKIIDGWKKK